MGGPTTPRAPRAGCAVYRDECFRAGLPCAKEETEVSWSAQLDLRGLPCCSSHRTPVLPRQVPGFILPLTRARAAFWGQSIRFWVEKLFSEKVSPHFPSTPGSEELIAHPLPKFLPMDPAEGGEPGEP